MTAVYTHKFAMLKSIASRCLKAAADNHRAEKQLASGGGESKLEMTQLLAEKADDVRIQYSFTTPQKPDASSKEVLLSDESREEVRDYDERRRASVIAATMLAADCRCCFDDRR